MNKKNIYVTHLYILCFIDVIISVPPLYCTQPFNSSDCFDAPTPVFSYYKAGSRCEIEIWRGCPTMNKFEDEYQCSHFCIGKFLHVSSENLKTNQSTCYVIFNRSKCTKEVVKVYTYDQKSKTCEPAVWRGCITGNIFRDESTCMSTCKSNNTVDSFKKKLNKLVPRDVKKVDSILDAIIGTEEEELKYIQFSLEDSTEKITPKAPEQITVTQSSLTDAYTDSTYIQENVTPTSVTSTSTIVTSTSTIVTSTSTIVTTILSEPSIITVETISEPDIATEKTTLDVVTTTSFWPSGTVEEVVLPDLDIE